MFRTSRVSLSSIIKKIARNINVDFEIERFAKEFMKTSSIKIAQKDKSICIDFDGTLVEYDSYKGPGVFGNVIDGAREVLQALHDDDWLIIIFTCRGEEDLIADYLQNNEIPFDYINQSPNLLPNSNIGKPYARHYIDDRAIEFTGDWAAVYERVTGQPWKENKGESLINAKKEGKSKMNELTNLVMENDGELETAISIMIFDAFAERFGIDTSHINLMPADFIETHFEIPAVEKKYNEGIADIVKAIEETAEQMADEVADYMEQAYNKYKK